jgi:hypothetical protein
MKEGEVVFDDNLMIMLVRQEGIEPSTHGLEGRCSIRLSYWRTKRSVLHARGAGQGQESARIRINMLKKMAYLFVVMPRASSPRP